MASYEMTPYIYIYIYMAPYEILLLVFRGQLTLLFPFQHKKAEIPQTPCPRSAVRSSRAALLTARSHGGLLRSPINCEEP